MQLYRDADASMSRGRPAYLVFCVFVWLLLPSNWSFDLIFLGACTPWALQQLQQLLSGNLPARRAG